MCFTCNFRGADKEWIDEKGRTPLLIATENGKAEAVIELLENGADVEEVDYEGKNVVHFIVIHGYVNMLKVRIIMMGAKHCTFICVL